MSGVLVLIQGGQEMQQKEQNRLTMGDDARMLGGLQEGVFYDN